MDSSQQKKRKAPPMPRFQQQQPKEAEGKKQQLQSKLNDFLTSLVKEPQSKEKTQQKIVSSQILQKPKDDKTLKKNSLANLNSKLNSMLNSKKINLNIAPNVQQPKQSKSISEVQLKPRKEIEIDYDPYLPNSYDQCKSHYIALFQSLATIHNQVTIPSEKIMEVEEQREDQMEQREQMALRMMQKFGYKVGDGLGKNSQGIKTPLTVKKITDSSCVIQPSAISLKELITPEASARNALEAFGIKPTRVIVLNGIVKLHQLTDQSENQIREQCSCYGTINNWMLYLPHQSQDLRIFVQYQSVEQAFQAFLRMNNLYFYESTVSIRFYDQQKFRKTLLSQPLHCHINI